MVSIRGYGDPLVVIDGITREGTEELAQLNSEDIESISILKDASAAIYGMNAANGVIIVTTKKGVAEKTRVSYSALFGMKNATGMEETVDAYRNVLGQGTLFVLRRFHHALGGTLRNRAEIAENRHPVRKYL